MGRRIALSSQPLTVGVITRSGALDHSGVQAAIVGLPFTTLWTRWLLALKL